jgi:MoaA/NifB/PqqE/SkfB family radical SAM enzyme
MKAIEKNSDSSYSSMEKAGRPTTARVITTFDCSRNCPGCCNTYGSIMSNARNISSLSELKNFQTICLTGGEPMEEPQRTIQIIKAIRKTNLKAKIFLYTALYKEEVKDIIQMVDGIHFTLHVNATKADLDGFQKFQEAIKSGNGSYRLYIDPRVEGSISIQPNLWHRIEVKPWLSEKELLDLQPKGLPRGEELIILNPATQL